MWIEFHKNGVRLSRYTYRCVALPDADDMITVTFLLRVIGVDVLLKFRFSVVMVG